MKKNILLGLISILVIGLLAACGTKDNEPESGQGAEGENSEKKTLTVGTSADYAPFEYIDTAKSDEIIGFDIDIINSIADKLGYNLKITDTSFDGLIIALEANKFDFVISGMTPTPKRKENVDFTDVYYVANHMIVSKKDSGINTIEDLKGKTVGVQLGSIQEEEANSIAETVDITIESRSRIPELLQEIQIGRFDAAIIEDTVAQGYLNKMEDLSGFTIEGDEEEVGYAIAFPKGSGLTEEFNNALNEMKENGELDKLIIKWFGEEEEK
ncbi:transporter substrate-binding domain-containing protein [Cytobacillus sp. IB215316]|uniref:transporter substrate-binding domain-containing protein n=1 Tax=Cytobacillus sp. IB215316 TaxID=3097354 RepID=UPI002A14D005|nr:transporter substrate-binding domain-containing protein [Cytobacillus sp. IB215316]MDX8359671.1 transporter substrate-binding domain-containing protein [Cytobacillus sp. IB215316]